MMTDATQALKGDDVPRPVKLMQMMTGYWISQAIYAAAKLGIADLLADGPKSCDELARVAETQPPTLYRLLRALSSVGVFCEQGDGRFSLTPLAELLRADVPGSLRAFSLLQSELQYSPYGEILHSLKTGETGFKSVYGQELFPYVSEHPAAAEVFDAAMTGYTRQVSADVADAYDFSEFDTLVDVGGGHGILIQTILNAYPDLTGVLFDLPHVATDAQKRLDNAGLVERARTVGGDFFTDPLPSGDVVLLKWIIHDWDDERAIALLKNCHRALPENGKLLLVEVVIDPGQTPPFHMFLDLTMLVVTGGLERTESEYRALLDAAGFRMNRIVATRSETSVVEAIRT